MAVTSPATPKRRRRRSSIQEVPSAHPASARRPADPVAGLCTIDASHTSIEFVGRHVMITKVRGRFPDVSGTITIEDEPERSHVEVELEVATLDTGNADRDGHLRSPDFFNG